MHLAENIKFMRNRRKVSQQLLAEELGITRSKLNSYERGVQPNTELLIQLSLFFNVSIDDFIKKNTFNCSIICDGRFAKIEKFHIHKENH